MKLNTKTRYGLRTMIEIASHDEGILQKHISANQGISTKYLDQIISALKSNNLITNVAGKKSGYILTRPANEITVYDIYCTFSGELRMIGCLAESLQCNKENACAAKEVWEDLNQTIIDKLCSVTLQQLVSRQQELEEQVDGPMYYI